MSLFAVVTHVYKRQSCSCAKHDSEGETEGKTPFILKTDSR